MNRMGTVGGCRGRCCRPGGGGASLATSPGSFLITTSFGARPPDPEVVEAVEVTAHPTVVALEQVAPTLPNVETTPS